ncbi:MAG: ankyrin repeat domain-containing protein, partial [Fuerstiella sp.]
MKTQIVLLLAFSLIVGCGQSKPRTAERETLWDLQVKNKEARERQEERDDAKKRRDNELETAARSGDWERFNELIRDGGDKTLALRLAATEGELDLCRRLIAEGADVNDGINGGFPVVIDALKHPTILQLLVDSGAESACRVTYEGFSSGPAFIGHDSTLLHHAAAKGVAETVEMLIESGLSVSDRNDEQQTPLHLAAIFGNGSIVRVLIEHGADENVRDVYGQLPKDQLCQCVSSQLKAASDVRVKSGHRGVGYVDRFQHERCWERSACRTGSQ